MLPCSGARASTITCPNVSYAPSGVHAGGERIALVQACIQVVARAQQCTGASMQACISIQDALGSAVTVACNEGNWCGRGQMNNDAQAPGCGCTCY